MQNRVNLNNLANIRSLRAGTITARALATLRAAVQGVSLNRAVAAGPEGGAAATADMATLVNYGLPRMRPGAERC